MKKLFIIFVSVVAVFTACKHVDTNQKLSVSFSGSVPVNAIDNTSGLRSLTAHNNDVIRRLGYYDAGDGGDALFIFMDTVTSPDDGGKYIKPNSIDSTDPGRWVMQIDRDVNVLSFGAKRDNSADASRAIQRAITAAAPIKNNSYLPIYGYGNVVIPGGEYRIDSTIKLRNSVNIIGNGSGFFPSQEVRLIYAGNTRGFDIRADNNNGGARSIIIKNIFLRNFGVSTDSTTHGIFTNTRIHLENVGVENFGGDGFHFETNDSGNANNSVIMDCTAYYNAKNGIFFSGNESNNIGIYSSDFSANGMCGVLDNSFLGNMYYNCHTSSNGLRNASTYSKTWCTVAGKVYQCIKYPNVKGVQPTVTSGWQNYWIENPTVFGTTMPDPYSADSIYWVTGSYVVASISATSSFYGCYSEGGQGSNILNNFSACYGGDQGAIFASKDNIYLNPSASQLLLRGGGFKAYDADSVKTFSGFNNKFGLQLGSEKTGHGTTQFKYFESDRTTKLFADNSTGNSAFEILGKGFNPASLGLSTMPRTGLPSFLYYSGFWMGDNNNGALRHNVLCSRYGPPSSGEHAAGSWCLYTGNDTTIIGWKCITSGTPGTWVKIKSAN